MKAKKKTTINKVKYTLLYLVLMVGIAVGAYFVVTVRQQIKSKAVGVSLLLPELENFSIVKTGKVNDFILSAKNQQPLFNGSASDYLKTNPSFRYDRLANVVINGYPLLPEDFYPNAKRILIDKLGNSDIYTYIQQAGGQTIYGASLKLISKTGGNIHTIIGHLSQDKNLAIKKISADQAADIALASAQKEAGQDIKLKVISLNDEYAINPYLLGQGRDDHNYPGLIVTIVSEDFPPVFSVKYYVSLTTGEILAKEPWGRYNPYFVTGIDKNNPSQQIYRTSITDPKKQQAIVDNLFNQYILGTKTNGVLEEEKGANPAIDTVYSGLSTAYNFYQRISWGSKIRDYLDTGKALVGVVKSYPDITVISSPDRANEQAPEKCPGFYVLQLDNKITVPDSTYPEYDNANNAWTKAKNYFDYIMFYCDGFVDKQSVAHEISHIVYSSIITKMHTFPPFYYYQSGSIQEGIADFMSTGVLEGDSPWTVGQGMLPDGQPLGYINHPESNLYRYCDTWTPANVDINSLTALQRENICFGPQPVKYLSSAYRCDEFYHDNLNLQSPAIVKVIESNAGIIKKGLYLISDGTTDEPHNEFNGFRFAGIGRQKVYKIVYESIKTLVGQSKFYDFYSGMNIACTSLIGQTVETDKGAQQITLNDCTIVDKALRAVQIDNSYTEQNNDLLDVPAPCLTPTVTPTPLYLPVIIKDR